MLSSCSGGLFGTKMQKRLFSVSLKFTSEQLRKLASGEFSALQFTCTHGDKYAEACSTSPQDRTVTKVVSKQAYQKGVVFAKCPCEKLHLVADSLGWFDDEKTNIENILKEKGEQVKKLTVDDLFSLS